jgi:hypothetical protein
MIKSSDGSSTKSTPVPAIGLFVASILKPKCEDGSTDRRNVR